MDTDNKNTSPDHQNNSNSNDQCKKPKVDKAALEAAQAIKDKQLTTHQTVTK